MLILDILACKKNLSCFFSNWEIIANQLFLPLLLQSASLYHISTVLIAVIESLMRGNKFSLGKTLLHILAERSEDILLERLLNRMDLEQRSRLLSLRNHAEQTALDVAQSYKVRKLLEWSDSQDGYYYLQTQPVVLMMPIITDREQAQEEIIQLEAAFPEFNVRFETVTNPGKDQMLEAIQNIVRQVNGDASALIVIIMAHGVEGRVFAADGTEVQIQDILLQMQAALPGGKPKVTPPQS